jgi:hypothetical protein
LSRNAPFRIRGIFRHESNFIQSDSRTAAEICLEALSKRRALDRGLHKRANEGKKIFARHLGTERDARYVCVRKQVGKFAFGGSRLKRHSIEQQLRTRGTQQQTRGTGRLHRLLELVPANLELRRRAKVF